ncbi:MAG TPA: N-acetyltransferase [Anaerolineales bacterium]|nr:N-acetyltransferase [Anaerolineales bacterium]
MAPSDASPSITIAAAGWRDFRDVLALERVCFENDSWPWIDVMAALTFPEAVRLKAMARPDGSAAAESARSVGFVFGDRRRSEGMGWIASIGVHPAYQRRGIGTRLLAACERALGTPQVRLTLRPSNTGARRVYDAAGYVEVARLERYYRDGEDGIVMEKLRAGERSVVSGQR